MKRLLRLYAVKYGENYLVTEGCIKLTQTMQQQPRTNQALSNLTTLLRILDKERITIQDLENQKLVMGNDEN